MRRRGGSRLSLSLVRARIHRSGWGCLVVTLAALLSACGTRHEILGTISSPGGGADAAPPLPAYIIGADISYAQQQEQSGVAFTDTDGTPKDILQILEGHGFNFIRLRTFVDPSASDGYATMLGLSQPYCDLANTIVMGQRIKAAGLGFQLDFHYSDDWADVTKQVIPLAWQGDTLPQMVAALQTTPRTLSGSWWPPARAPTSCRSETKSRRGCC